MPESPASAPPGSAGTAKCRSGRVTQAWADKSPVWFMPAPDGKGACWNGSEHNDPQGRMEELWPGINQNLSKSAALWKSPATLLRTGMNRSSSNGQRDEDR